VTGDLLAHCIDTARWINGDITEVSAMTETFIKERVHTATGKKQAVTIDDAAIFLCRFENGSIAQFESTRYARGHKALYTFEINGEKKSLQWDLHDLNRLNYFDHAVPGDRRGWSSIHASDSDHPYAGNWWVPGLCLGYEHSFTHALAEFLKSLDDPKAEKAYPDFRHALGTQYVCDAILESAKTKQWVKVKKA
jgi:predicted dehydrogenase